MPADRRFPFATIVTIVTKDYPGFDTESNLDRPGVFRVNFWASLATFESLFGGRDRAGFDFAALDTPLPHPVYGAQSWVSILNPGPATSEQTKALMTQAHERASPVTTGGHPAAIAVSRSPDRSVGFGSPVVVLPPDRAMSLRRNPGHSFRT